MRDKDGLVVFLGNTKGTLQRNLIEPLQQMWGNELVGDINSSNKVFMFGEWCYALGADKVTAVNRLRGSSIKLTFGDEVVSWNEEVFEMLKSRLDKNYSQFFGTANPDHPSHFLKKNFIDTAEERGIDLFYQQYSLKDNPYCEIADELEKEYTGVYYERYVLGNWKNANGLVYPEFAQNHKKFMIKRADILDQQRMLCGVDFGKNASKMGFVASSIHDNKLFSLYAKDVSVANLTFNEMRREFSKMVDELINIYPNNKIDFSFADSAEPTYITSLKQEFPQLNMRGSIKREILDRIRATNILMGGERFHVVEEHCKPLIDGLFEAVWNEKKLDKDERLDDGSTNIDILDSFEYSFEYYIPQLVRL